MNSKNLFLLIFIGLMSCSSCSIPMVPDPPDPVPPVDTSNYPLTIKWETYFYPDTSVTLGNSEYKLYKDLVLYCVQKYPENEHLHIFNKHTGEQLKNFDLGPNSIREYAIYDKYLIITSLDGVKIFDLEKLSLIKTINGSFHHEVTIYGNEAYVIKNNGAVPYLTSCDLMKITFPSLKMEKVFTITEDEYGGYAALNPISIDINTEGDTLIYGVMETFPVLLYCYNKTKGDYEWQSDQSGKADVYYSKPLLDEEHVYITMHRGVEAYDKATGEQVWRTELDGECGYRPCEPLLYEGKLYVKECGPELYCVNASNGGIIWHTDYDNEFPGTSPSNYLTHHNGYLYYSSDEFLKVISMKTGKVVLRIRGPYGDITTLDPDIYLDLYASFDKQPVLIDAENNVMYLTDNKRIFCFELYEP